MAMLALVLSGAYTLQRQGLYSYLMGSAKVEAQQNARVALDLMIRELRSATSVTAIAAGDLTFVDQNGVTIRYNLTGTTLQRTANAVVDVLIGGVQSLALTYQDSNGAPTAAAANVSNIVIAITTQ